MTEVTQHRAEAADGTSLAWYDFGGTGPALMLGHATGFSGRIWEPLLPFLLPYAHCYSYDLRGHGASGRPKHGRRGFAWDRYADDLLRVLKLAGLSDAFGFGHSCGGATQLLAEQAAPGTFQAMFLFEPVVFAVDPPTGPDPDRDLAVRTRKRRASFPSRQDAHDNFSERGPFASLAPKALDAYLDHGFVPEEDGSVTLACAPDDEADVYVMASAHDGYVHLPEVRCPVTVGRGADSRSFSAQEMTAVAERLPRGTFVEYEGLGHFGPLEQPERVAAAALKSLGLA